MYMDTLSSILQLQMAEGYYLCILPATPEVRKMQIRLTCPSGYMNLMNLGKNIEYGDSRFFVDQEFTHCLSNGAHENSFCNGDFNIVTNVIG